MRQPTFTVLSLLLLSPSLATPAPHAASQQCSLFDTRCHNHPPHPWRRLSDALIRRIWGLPEKQKGKGAANGDPAAVGGTPARKLLARYGEDIVMRFNITTAEEASALADASDILFLDVWEFNENWCDIRIAKDVVSSLLGLLPASLQTSHVALMQDLDLAQAIFDSYPTPSATQSHDGDRSFSPSLKTSSQSENIFFQDYQPLSVITPWMNLLASMFTTHVRRINVGISYEGRDIPALRVGVHPTNDEQQSSPRKTVLIVGGSHAREWISTSTVNYLAWSLITSYGKINTVTKMLESFDFVFVPTLNPDGYVYSWETDRLWRKNRQPTSLRFCRGIDLDRSYSYQWDGDSTRQNPCSESFAGDAPFDGAEAQRFAEWAKNETENNNVDFVGFLDLHSYSQQVLYPYSFSCYQEPPTIEDLEELAMGLAKAIRVSHKGHPYQVTSACEGNVAVSKNSKDGKGRKVLPRIESSGGSALDWFYHELRVKYAYQIKLRDTGSYGFLLPKENIVPTGKELLDAVLYLGRFMLGEVGFETSGAPGTASEEPVLKVLQHDEHGNVEETQDWDYEDSPMELRRRRKR
ncbi:putative metallocarboxypeptidase ECM14 [Lindgomyces ingoldianus]|uniref:Metallocarboxypeptidase ECM14 n=1 Tax=Lindgomyces ingoldianus TaxID=673940 RepID=A0ACB6RE62_9PLEO|nr:putative metallocarboxypeptidase ECM14 [Lindgomyces ingoldianus]KAF2477481.1 putative metallocarboxypeptidase ECM14 [Lindgomyces ingoldianus]